MSFTATIATINEFIEINNDRIQVYNMAIFKAEQSSICKLFELLILSSKTANEYLIFEIRKLSGSLLEDTTSLGKLEGVWPTLESAILDKDNQAILNACLDIETISRTVYYHTLSIDQQHIPKEMFFYLESQLQALYHDKLMIMEWQIV
jgi:hypothetical protein